MAVHLLYDFNNLAIRARSRGGPFVDSSVPTLMNSKGIFTGTLFYMLNIIKADANKFNPVSITMVEDSGYNKHRVAFYPEYKAKRKLAKLDYTEEEKAIHEDFIRQRELFKLICSNVKIKHIKAQYTEADDVIAYIAHLTNHIPPFTYAGNLKHRVIIVSNDSDFVHLVSENVEVFAPQSNTYNSISDTDPEMVLLKKSILGDAMDEITNIPQIGEATADKILALVRDKYGITNIDYDKVKQLCMESAVAKIRKVADNFDIVTRNKRVISLKYNDGFVKYLEPEVKSMAKEIFLSNNMTENLSEVFRLCMDNEFRSIYSNIREYFKWVNNLK